MILSIFFVCTYNIDFYFLSCALLLIKYTKSSHTANVNKTQFIFMPMKTDFHGYVFRNRPIGILVNYYNNNKNAGAYVVIHLKREKAGFRYSSFCHPINL
jgi:hypothetical protein